MSILQQQLSSASFTNPTSLSKPIPEYLLHSSQIYTVYRLREEFNVHLLPKFKKGDIHISKQLETREELLMSRAYKTLYLTPGSKLVKSSSWFNSNYPFLVATPDYLVLD